MALITFQMHMPARAGPAGEGASLRAAADSVNRKGVTGCIVARQQQAGVQPHRRLLPHQDYRLIGADNIFDVHPTPPDALNAAYRDHREKGPRAPFSLRPNALDRCVFATLCARAAAS